MRNSQFAYKLVEYTSEEVIVYMNSKNLVNRAPELKYR